MDKNIKTVLIVGIIAVLSIVATVSYAYFTATFQNLGDRTTSITTQTMGSLKLEAEETLTFDSNGIYPGEMGVQEFTITPISTGSGVYEIDVTGVINEAIFGSDVVIELYKVTNNEVVTVTKNGLLQEENKFYYADTLDTDGLTPIYSSVLVNGENKLYQEDFIVVDDNGTLKIKENSEDSAVTSYTYYLVYKYLDSGSQNSQMNQSFSGTVSGKLILEKDKAPNEVTLAKLQALDSTLKLNESMNSKTGTCPTYDADAKTINVTAEEDNASLLCEAEDDYGTTYYYRGNVTNNYVSFAGFIWRIVRINGDGSIRLVYDGTTPYKNINAGGSESDGENRQIGTREFNSLLDDNAYVGYMYKSVNADSYANTFDVMNNKNASASTVKGSIDYWYAHNIDIPIESGSEKKFSDYVSLDTIFCNDKNIDESYINNESYNKGYAKNETIYRWLNFTDAAKKTRFTCVNNQGTVDSKNDAFSVSDKGNGALTYPVALLTTDEVVAAGGYNRNTTPSHYLRTGSWYWTMSPPGFWSSRAFSMRIYSTGSANDGYSVNESSGGVRPVLSLDYGVEFENGGDGTFDNPFVVDVS